MKTCQSTSTHQVDVLEKRPKAAPNGKNRDLRPGTVANNATVKRSKPSGLKPGKLDTLRSLASQARPQKAKDPFNRYRYKYQ